MEPDYQIGYGIRNGALVHISDVSRGLECNCLCVVCNTPLIAKKGNKRRHHFAHAVECECHGAGETILHRLAKELLSELDFIALPPYLYKRERKLKCGLIVKHEQQIANGGKACIDSVKTEFMLTGFRPDVIINSNGNELIIEIAVTHKVDRNKRRSIRRMGLAAIEIRLSMNDSLLPRHELRSALQENLFNKHWLFHPRQREEERKFYDKARRIRKNTNLKTQSSLARLAPDKPSMASRRVHFNRRNRGKYTHEDYERVARHFYSKNNRYPTLEECKRLWPKMWGK